MSVEDKMLQNIQKAAQRRKKAAEARWQATHDLRRYCWQAREAGVPITRIASEADLSRQGVYDLLGERPSA
jgi:hypothetical protein